VTERGDRQSGSNLTALESDPWGVVFDDAGEAWPAEPHLLAQRLGSDADALNVVANAVTNLGFVHVAPIRNALSVTFEPTVVSPLAAFAAFYEIAAQGPQCLILTNPGMMGQPDRCEIVNDVIDGLRRLEQAANRGRNAIRPSWLQTPAVNRRYRPHLWREHPKKKLLEGITPANAPQIEVRAGDRSIRLPKPLNAIPTEDDWLGRLLSFWGSARSGRRLPSTESLDSLELLNIARGRAHIVETLSANPNGYRFRLWGAVNSYGGGYANRALGEMPQGLMREDAIEDYRRIVATGTPAYHLINIVENELSFSYARLLLPLAQDGRRVDRLIVLINERQLPELAAAL
jgi:hypothetical protein